MDADCRYTASAQQNRPVINAHLWLVLMLNWVYEDGVRYVLCGDVPFCTHQLSISDVAAFVSLRSRQTHGLN